MNPNQTLKLSVGSFNKKWRNFHMNGVVGLEKVPLITPDTKIFSMGSCFAEEIRKVFTQRGFQMLPNFSNLDLPPDRCRVDTLPSRPHLNYYNSYTILQELQRAFGLLEFDPEDFWIVKDKIWGGNEVYQDPYKRLVFGREREDLISILRAVNTVIDEGVKSADAFVFTFGMAEVFKNIKTGLVVAQKPLYGGWEGGLGETELHRSSFSDNKANIQAIVDLIHQNLRSSVPIFMSVSPVPLERTFSDGDVFVANAESKAILRAAISEVARENTNVFYFPSFDLIQALGSSAFKENDGRHVKDTVVQHMIECFCLSYMDD